MRYIEALETFVSSPDVRSLFLAGSINGAPDWQAEYRTLFEDTDLVLLNPRRSLVNNRGAWDSPEGERQIDWEFEHLRKASAVSFWFTAEGSGYSSAWEIGAMLERDIPVFVGVHPAYWKAATVAYQAQKRRPALVVVDTLHKLANEVRNHFGYASLRDY